jgi:hypothetical protein
MEITETKKSGGNSSGEGSKELAPFIPRENSRITEDEQRRFEKKVRVYLHDAVMKARGKQWDLALGDIERAMKVSADLGWKEATACAQSIRDTIAQRRSSSVREATAKVAQERFDKRKTERQQRESAEHARLDALTLENQKARHDFVSLVKSSKKVDIASLGSALGLDEAAARARANEVAGQFGFKVDGHAILFDGLEPRGDSFTAFSRRSRGTRTRRP